LIGIALLVGHANAPMAETRRLEAGTWGARRQDWWHRLTWLRIDCVARRGLREVVGQDFGFYKDTIPPGKKVSVGVAVALHGLRADRAACEVYLTDKTDQSEYERRLR
jgi:hypothetical protein